MARIAVEENWWTDPRRTKLMFKAGSESRADGAMLKVWRISQDFWKNGRRPMPKPVFYELDLAKEIVEIGLAIEDEDFVYVRGSKQHHEWLTRNAEHGSKGGKARGPSKSRNHREIPQASASECKPSSSSSSSSSSSTSSSTQNKYVPEGVATQPTSDPEGSTLLRDLNRRIWEEYSKAYRDRYGTEPVRNATVNSQISSVGKRLGGDAPEVARFYLSHNNSFYVRSLHPVGLLLKDCEGLATQWKRGRAVTENEARAADKSGGLRAQLDRIAKGEI